MNYEEQIEELREDLIRQVNQRCDSVYYMRKESGSID